MSQWKWNGFKGYPKRKRLPSKNALNSRKKIRQRVGLESYFVKFLRLVFNAASFICIIYIQL